MVFGFAELVEYLSAHMTLEPGDLVATGTPAGVGPLVAGDVVEVRLVSAAGEVLATLSNPVVDLMP
jgi:2-keto-4-pentenoate hydratase/2-oxohepta-3-ene-1,7-dioic acid hydratase in catechol pathway